jgi:ADP-ribosylglycohydrolase
MHPTHTIASLLALAVGDAFGAPYEGGPVERALWAVIGTKNGRHRWTDDTQMTIDVIESLIACGGVDQQDLATRFARSYRWSRGYGPGAARVLKRIRRGEAWQIANRSVYPVGSFGNGAAMRAPAIGLFYADAGEDELVEAARCSAVVTHAHPDGCTGAVLVALATALAGRGQGSQDIIARLSRYVRSGHFAQRLELAGTWLREDCPVAAKQVAAGLGNGIAAIDSCITSVYLALRFRSQPLEDLLAFAIDVGGDVDTIAAMAGAIWGAGRDWQALPQDRLLLLEQCDRLHGLATKFADASIRVVPHRGVRK